MQVELAVQEGRLTWLVYLIGSSIGGCYLVHNNEYDAMDSELACRVLQLMQLTDNRLAQGMSHLSCIIVCLMLISYQMKKRIFFQVL